LLPSNIIPPKLQNLDLFAAKRQSMMQDPLDQMSLQKSVLRYFVGETGCGRHNSRRWKTTELFIPSQGFRAFYHSRYKILAKSGTLYVSSGVSECCFLLWIGIMPKKPIYLAHLITGTTHLWHGQSSSAQFCPVLWCLSFCSITNGLKLQTLNCWPCPSQKMTRCEVRKSRNYYFSCQHGGQNL
jgi:hypothetical protein